MGKPYICLVGSQSVYVVVPCLRFRTTSSISGGLGLPGLWALPCGLYINMQNSQIWEVRTSSKTTID